MKLDWIRSKIGTVANFGDLNTPNLVPNPTPQGKIPKAVNLTVIVAGISDADVLTLNTEYSPIVAALIENINKGAIADVANLVRGLMASALSQDAKDVISTNFQSIAASYQNPSQYGDLDPNWQSQILATPAELAGFSPVTLQEWEEANAV